ncbi:MAG: Mov34/MPN/PAD-1 family protein [bacterium]|nr:Mov34/MPN/PAD-1 family protein [bacterium]
MAEISFYLKDEDFEKPPEDIYYLLAANGLFKITKTFAFTASTVSFTPRKGKELKSLKVHEEELKLHLPKKIPSSMFLDSLGFFREIYRLHQSEAEVLLYWSDKEKEYVLIVPEQMAGSMALSAEVGANPKGLDRVGTMHSHGDLWAFHSEIDDRDEEHDDGLHITFGDVMDFPSISCSVVVDGRRFMVQPKNIFELEPFKLPLVPKAWVKKVKPIRG